GIDAVRRLDAQQPDSRSAARQYAVRRRRERPVPGPLREHLPRQDDLLVGLLRNPEGGGLVTVLVTRPLSVRIPCRSEPSNRFRSRCPRSKAPASSCAAHSDLAGPASSILSFY